VRRSATACACQQIGLGLCGVCGRALPVDVTRLGVRDAYSLSPSRSLAPSLPLSIHPSLQRLRTDAPLFISSLYLCLLFPLPFPDGVAHEVGNQEDAHSHLVL
jgi:hypothetical protein